MTLNKQVIDSKLANAGRKLEYYRPRFNVPGQREGDAVNVHTVGRILQCVQNMLFSSEWVDPVEKAYEQFGDYCREQGIYENFASAGTGYSDVSNLPGRSAEDISIIMAITSLEAYLVASRALSQPEDSISYQNIIAMNTTGGVQEGEVVHGPFSPPNLNPDLALEGVDMDVPAGTNPVLSFGGPLVHGGVLVKITDATGNMSGRDFNRDGIVQWSFDDPNAANTTTPPVVSINYNTGAVTLQGNIAANKIKVTATRDSHADHEGTGIIRVKPEFPTTLLTCAPRNIILESNIASESYRNKMLSASIAAGMTVNLAEESFKLVLNSYLTYLNKTFVQLNISAAELAKLDQPGGNYVEGDISGYSIGTSFSNTKDDILDDFFLRMSTQLLLNCGSGPTCVLVGPMGATKLGNNKRSFVPGPAFHQDIDSLVGTYAGIPVIRHRSVELANKVGTGYVPVIMIHKDPQGRAAPAFFGEYLSPASSTAAINFLNPTQYSKSLFSFIGTKIVIPRLACAGRLKILA